MVGSVGFHTVSALNRTAEINYDVHPAYWGRGIATAACAAAANWGFSTRGFVRIQATVLALQHRISKALRGCGFQMEASMRSFRLVRGEPRDYVLYSLLPGDGIGFSRAPAPASGRGPG